MDNCKCTSCTDWRLWEGETNELTKTECRQWISITWNLAPKMHWPISSFDLGVTE